MACRFAMVAFLALTWLSAASPSVAAEPWKFSREQVKPFWRSTTMHGESVLFLREKPGAAAKASLLMTPTRVLAVCSSSGAVTYQEGKDYTWKPGSREIVVPPGSAIVCKAPADLRRPAGTQAYRLTHRDGNGEILFGGGHEYHDMQTVVTYEHRPDAWKGPRPSFDAARLPRSVARLRAKHPLAIALLGDSISTGCNASGWAKAPPMQPPYQDLLVLNLEAAYGVRPALFNFAVSGTDTGWGLANIGKVIAARPNLVILAFGMNDAAGRSPADYQANIRAMIDSIGKALPEAEIILVATMLGNTDWTILQRGPFAEYRNALARLCKPGVALADMTSIWAEMLKHKRDWDLTGNGVNHPNDFGHRVYAQVLSTLLVPGE